MSLSMHNRRRFLQMLAGAGAALPLARFFPSGVAHAAGRSADRVVFFYVPDGIHEADWGTAGRQWGALGTRASDCTLLTGVRMDEDQSQEGHPGGARRLLCGDAGYGTSVDQFLARSVGAGTFFPHVYLGGIATRQGSVKTDEMISWKDGSPPTPEDNPVQAFSRLFPNGTVFSSGGAPGTGSGGGTIDPAARAALERRASVLDAVLGDLKDLRGALPADEQRKLDRHLEATREVERRVKAQLAPPVPPTPGTMDPDPGAVTACQESKLDTRGLDGTSIFDATRFPDIVATQLDVLTQALACGVTRVATLQLSRHTSDLFMPFVPGDLKQQSHEASHNNQNVYLDQRVWLMQQYKGFLDRLAARPDPYVKGATLLDRTLVLFCTEINWGPTHRYTNMPFILAGGQGAGLRQGGALAVDAIHHRVHASIVHALGSSTQGWRDAPQPLPQLAP